MNVSEGHLSVCLWLGPMTMMDVWISVSHGEGGVIWERRVISNKDAKECVYVHVSGKLSKYHPTFLWEGVVKKSVEGGSKAHRAYLLRAGII